MSVYDNMAFGLKLRKTPSNLIEERVREAAGLLGIEQLLDRKPKQLSGGQRQRVALGRAIVREPAVFLLDEPLSNLDAKLRVQTRSEISKLHQRLETTFIYVTHDQVEAMTMGNRIAVLRDGLLQQIDTPQNLYDYPTNMFVAGFIGSPAMNFFDATLVKDDRGVWVDTGNFRVQIPDAIADEPAVQHRLGDEIIFGIRPEDIHNANFAPPGITKSPLTAEVDVTELMGNEIFVHLLSGENEFIARVDPRSDVTVGHEVPLVMNMDNVHLFDRDTKESLTD
jgi:multiple sugar transport system ATP-binding protein